MHFVVGHPRSGTRLVAAILDAAAPGRAAHEHLAEITGLEHVGAASAWYEGRLPRARVRELIGRYGHDGVVVDSNWKLTWTLDVLVEAFPEARILHLVREPRANVAACLALDYYGGVIARAAPEALLGRLGLAPSPGAMRLLRTMRTWYAGFPRIRRDDWDGLGQLERNCAFWVETHRLALDHVAGRPGYRRQGLADLRDPETARELVDFFGLPRLSRAAAERVLGDHRNDHARLRDAIAALGGGAAVVDDRVVAAMCGEMAATLGV